MDMACLLVHFPKIYSAQSKYVSESKTNIPAMKPCQTPSTRLRTNKTRVLYINRHSSSHKLKMQTPPPSPRPRSPPAMEPRHCSIREPAPPVEPIPFPHFPPPPLLKRSAPLRQPDVILCVWSPRRRHSYPIVSNRHHLRTMR